MENTNMKRYLITGHHCGKLITKIVQQLDMPKAITRFCVENNIPEDQIFSVQQYGL